MSKALVLFFAADPFSAPPGGGPRLQLDRDVRLTREKVRGAKHRDSLVFDYWMAARADDLIQGLNEASPQVVHFSGHGSSEGLVLEGRDGGAHLVSAAALEDLFRVFRGDIQVVVLNACLSLPQAQAIAAVVGCAIGTGKKISDEAAMTFGASFYRALAFGRSVQTAFDQARVALQLEHPGEAETPQIIAGPGVDPARIFVIRPENAESTTTADEGSAAGRDRPPGIAPPLPTETPSAAGPGDSRQTGDVHGLASRTERRSWMWLRVAVVAAVVLVGVYALRDPIGRRVLTSPRSDSTSPRPEETTSTPVIGGTVTSDGPENSVPSPSVTQPVPKPRRADSALARRGEPEPELEASPLPASASSAAVEPSPPATGSVVERVRTQIGGDQYRVYEVAITDSRPCRLRGRVETLQGGSRDIDVLVLEEDAFQSFRQSRRYTPLFAARRTSEISLDVPLPGPGTYHLVISNVFSAFAGKVVLVEDVRWECRDGGGDSPA